MGKFARSWELMKASAGVLRSDKSLLVFPLLSGICSLVVMASFLIPVAAMTIEGEQLGVHYQHGLSTASWTLLFFFYLVQYFVLVHVPKTLSARGVGVYAGRKCRQTVMHKKPLYEAGPAHA